MTVWFGVNIWRRLSFKRVYNCLRSRVTRFWFTSRQSSVHFIVAHFLGVYAACVLASLSLWNVPGMCGHKTLMTCEKMGISKLPHKSTFMGVIWNVTLRQLYWQMYESVKYWYYSFGVMENEKHSKYRSKLFTLISSRIYKVDFINNSFCYRKERRTPWRMI